MFIIVLAPDEKNKDLSARVLYSSNEIRSNAGRNEGYLILLTTQQLEKSGIALPNIPDSPEPVLEALVKQEIDRKLIHQKTKILSSERVKIERSVRNDYKENFEQKFLKSISKFPDNLVNPNRIITREEEIEEKTKLAVKEGVKNVINDNQGKKRPIQRSRVFLTNDQQEMLNEFRDENGSIALTSEQMKSLLGSEREGNQERPIFLLNENHIFNECLKNTAPEKCAEEYLGLSNGSSDTSDESSGDPDGGGNGSTDTDIPISSTDIPAYISRMIDSASTPETTVKFGDTEQSKRPSSDDVQASIDSFSLRSSPADTPAFYDFHNLQVAFEHVWQQVFDDDLLFIAKKTYGVIKEMGGNPNDKSYRYSSPLDALKEESELIESAMIQGESSSIMFSKYRSDEQEPDIGLGGNDGNDNDDNDGGRNLGNYTGAIIGDPLIRFPKDLLERLQVLMRGDYAFTVYGASRKDRSVNFGVITTYRQKWEPIQYQVGELVKTITLAPKEVRKFSQKTVIKRRRSEKELEKYSSTRRDEFNQTSRAESEILRKAFNKTNFELTADGSYNFGIAKGKSDTTIGRGAENISNEIKKNFREAIIKSAQEYREERTFEINTEISEDFEGTVSGELQNINEEIPVTYLFYELQRRYRISEQIHRIMPVVLVAQEVPKPNEINDAWLVAHDWIIRRVILDESLIAALDYLSSNVVGDEYALEHMRKNVELHRSIVNTLKDELKAAQGLAERRYEALYQAILDRAGQVGEGESDSFFEDIGEFFGGGGEEPEAARIREDAARDAEERAVERVKELTMKLEREITALNAVIEKYTSALSKHKNRQVLIAKLRVHIKKNILYYMQAIWAHEMPDQRFFRLHQVKVPSFSEGEIGTKYLFTGESAYQHVVNVDGTIMAAKGYEFNVDADVEVEFDEKTLAEIADLDNLLGFKGNYMIFPLKETNPIVDFMMAPYVDSAFQAIDPDEPGNMNRHDFAKFVCCLHERLSEEEFNELKPVLKSQYEELLKTSNRTDEEIIVPTGSLFIEALPGTHALLEDFKLIHRAIDVKKVQAEVREMELENIRAAARLLASDSDHTLLEDPDSEKMIVIKGNGQGININPEG